MLKKYKNITATPGLPAIDLRVVAVLDELEQCLRIRVR